MRIIRVKHKGRAFYASIEEEGAKLHCLQTNLGYTDPIDMGEVSLIPLVSPSKIICAGLNFRGHAHELSMEMTPEPSFFLKPPSSLLGNGQPILIPRGVGRVDYEAELAVVIGQFCRNVRPDEASDFIFGYTCANDVTARDLQKGAVMMGRCKGYDSFCPLGPWIETEMPPASSGIRAVVNGETRQSGILEDMLMAPLELVSYISRIMSLSPGDVILTGTPRGVGPLSPGDNVRVEVDNVGVLVNDVQSDTGTLSSPEMFGHRLQ